MPVPLEEPALTARRKELLAQIAQLGDLRPGSLVERYKVCGAPAAGARNPAPAATAPNGS